MKKFFKEENKEQEDNNKMDRINVIIFGVEKSTKNYSELADELYDEYKELQTIKKAYPQAIMSGSGSTYFILKSLSSLNLSVSSYDIDVGAVQRPLSFSPSLDPLQSY